VLVHDDGPIMMRFLNRADFSQNFGKSLASSAASSMID
jgi:hypothetical protein